jgi:2-oxoglutarate dehydrogenase E2 component (dihydrolipoamide succinyltransferase)
MSQKKDIKVPPMGESIAEATIARWLKHKGDAVEMDEPLVELETDKVTLEVSSPATGVLSDILVKEGETVEIDTLIGQVTEGATSTQPQEKTPVPPVKEVTPAPVVKSTTPETSKARSRQDEEDRVPMSRLRQRIAERLKEAQNTAAILTTFNEVDMTNIINLRTQLKDSFERKHGVKLGFMSFFVKACLVALKEIPAINAEIDGDDFIYKNYYDIGVAVGTPQGLVVPVVRDADQKSFAEIEKDIAELSHKARDGKLTMQDLTGGTFTISNGGVYGSLMSTPILNPPQSGILGMHKIQDRAVVIDGKIEIRPMMYLALSYDHRLIDGREAVTFLVRVKECLDAPERMLLGM